MFRESGKRSFVKMLSWRVWATLTTMLLVYIFVGKASIAVSVGVVEVIAKMALYYVHERAWNKINFGRQMVEPFVLWFTGLPCSGKSTLADRVYDEIERKGYRVERLDGDTVRSFFPKMGFSKDERNEHIKRIGFLASMLERNGVIVVASFVSPYRESRDFVRGLCDNFLEVHVKASLEECERRDVKGMYKQARSGEIKNFTGVSDPYEPPERSEITINAESETVEESACNVMRHIDKYL